MSLRRPEERGIETVKEHERVEEGKEGRREEN